MRKYFGMLLLMVWLMSYSVMAQTDCTPFGLRIGLGRSYWLRSENETASIWFNTRNECSRSYVTIESGSSLKRTTCRTTKLSFGSYSTWVHRCSVDNVKKGGDFDYIAYGWDGSENEQRRALRSESHHVHLIGVGEDAKIVSIGDWGYLTTRAGEYDPLDEAFDGLLKTK
jgi:hypothetical protein